MPTQLPVNYYSVARLAAFQYVSLGNSIGVNFDGTAPFTVAAWINFPAPDSFGAFMSKGQQFSVHRPSSSQLGVEVGETRYTYNLVDPIPIGQWVYLVVTFAPVAGGPGLAVLTVYLSGINLGASTYSITGVQGTADFSLGGNMPVDFLAVTFHSEALTEQALFDWQVPPTGPTLAAAISFANGRAADLSGHGTPIAFQDGAQQYWVTPGLSLANAALQPNPGDQLNPGADNNSFSILSWVCPTAPSVSGYPQQTVLGNGQFAVFFGLQSSGQANGALSVLCKLPGFTAPAVGSIALNTWHHLGMTYDATTRIMSIYIDGQQVWTGPAGYLSPFAPLVWIGATYSPVNPAGFMMPFQGYLQGLSVWNSSLSPSQVADYMRAADPSGTPSCVAYFDFSTTTIWNNVTGNPPSFYNTPTVSGLPIPFAADDLEAPAPVPIARPRLRSPLAKLAATWDGREVPKPASDLLSSQQIDQLVADYTARASQLPEPLRSECVHNFTRNLYLGLQLQQEAGGPLPGTISFATEGSQHVFYYHTADGKEEILRADAIDVNPCTAWTILVIANLVTTVLNVVGVGVTLAKLQDAIKPLLERNASRLEILRALWNEPVTTGLFIKGMRTLWGLGILTNIIFEVYVGGSWWNFYWSIANTLLNIASLWITGGAYVLVVEAQLVLSLGQLGLWIASKPPEC